MSRSNTTEFINKAIAMTQEACDASAGASAELARAFYNEISSKLDRRTIADPTTSRNPEATENAVRSVGNPESDDRFDRIINRCCERASYEGKRAAGNTVTRSATSDPSRVKFARAPIGLETCDFCIMPVPRGFVYASAKTAGQFNHYHANCRCMTVPSFSGIEDIEGYSPSNLIGSKQNGAISGAHNDDSDPYFKKRLEHAGRYYESVKKKDRNLEIKSISENSGVDAEQVEKALKHLFVNRHQLDNGFKRFAPNCDISQSW